MRRTIFALVALLPLPAVAEDTARAHHALRVELDPTSSRLSVVDRIDLPRGGQVDFLLHARLTLDRSEPVARAVPLGDLSPFLGTHPAPVARAGAGELKRYRVEMPDAGGTLRLEYAGPFDFALDAPEEEYARGMRETTGIVSTAGVYLAGDGFWYARFDEEPVEFVLEAPAPPGWHLVAQGDGTSRGEDGIARWTSAGPADEIYLVGGPLHRYALAAGAAEAQVYLHETDEALAQRYLRATVDYLALYSGLIGPYPYGKFALVENFWETGYGMPSFTLLGPQVIRLPFILTSSYPHEVLHNWWGNSVFVDYASGNWCEGLTAYLADHLIQEQGGRGLAYRRDALQRYRSYVSDSRDFPLVEFRSRHSAATEAVGYGKTMMGFHMLRRRVGDDIFRDWLRTFYAEQRGRRAAFADLRRTLERVSGRDLARFFREWTERTGAPQLVVADVRVAAAEGAYVTHGVIRQTQRAEPFDLQVPIALQTAGAPLTTRLALSEREVAFTLTSVEPPLALHVDPAFDLFRLLDPLEIPPSIGQIFGEPRPLAVLPSEANPEETEAYRRLIESWASEHQKPDIVTDREARSLPADRAVWLLGRRNRLALELFAHHAGVAVEPGSLALAGERLPFAGHSMVVVTRNPRDAARAVGWIVVDPAAAFAGIARKLPHYGKYSYLGFEGAEATNVIKGQWSGMDSPLSVDLRSETERTAPLPPLALAPEPPLVTAPAESGPPSHPGARPRSR